MMMSEWRWLIDPTVGVCSFRSPCDRDVRVFGERGESERDSIRLVKVQARKLVLVTFTKFEKREEEEARNKREEEPSV
jgi:hypothetical protein